MSVTSSTVISTFSGATIFTTPLYQLFSTVVSNAVNVTVPSSVLEETNAVSSVTAISLSRLSLKSGEGNITLLKEFPLIRAISNWNAEFGRI